MRSPSIALFQLFFLCLVASGCGLVADSIAGPGKSSPSPRQVLEQRAGDALRDEFLSAIGVDPDMLADPQPLDRQATVSTELPVAFTEVPGVLRFHNHAGFRLSDFLRHMRNTYGVQLAVERSTKDELTGGRVSALRQLHNGVEVYGAFYRAIGNKEDEIVRATGHLYDELAEVSTEATLSQEAAMAPLKAAYPEIKNWVLVKEESELINAPSAGTARIYPGELQILPKAFHPDGKNGLTVKHRIVGLPPEGAHDVYLGANDPGLLKVVTKVHQQSSCEDRILPTTAKVKTLFHDQRTIPTVKICWENLDNKTDSVYRVAFLKHSVPNPVTFYSLSSSWFYKIDNSTGIFNVAYKTKTAPFSASPYGPIDVENKWTNPKVQGQGHLDAVWGLNQSYNYYRSLGRTDFMTKKDRLKVNFESPSSLWDESTQTIDLAANGGKFKPDTDLHTVAHEYTHIVTSRTAKLEYEGESGAINESISDIMALAITDYLKVAGPKWQFDHYHEDNGLRNFEDPHINKYAKMRKGKYWTQLRRGEKPVEANDYGGVHTNSSVMNHWSYLLSEGEKGKNEKGFAYQVTGIELQKVAAIVYRALNLYLGQTSDFEHARIATIIAAEDIHGLCSEEVEAVTNAWYAVGVGEPYALCDDTWLSFYTKPSHGAQVSIFLDKEMEVTVVENDYKITKVINYPASGRSARWVVSNKSDGSIVRSSLPLPYVGITQLSEEETFKRLGIALGKVSPDADTAYTAEHFDRDYLVKNTGKDFTGSYVRPDGIVVNRYHHPLLEGTDFWSTPQIKVPLLANNWAVRFGMLDPKMNPADNIFRGFLLAMEGPDVQFWVEPHDYRRDMNNPLFSDAAVFKPY